MYNTFKVNLKIKKQNHIIKVTHFKGSLQTDSKYNNYKL